MPPKEKKYYRIGEVSRITGVEPHVLRYWESEFPQIRPRRVARQRLFRKKDVEIINRIRQLLHEEGFTISGARKHLSRKQAGQKELKDMRTASVPADPRDSILRQVKNELVEIERLLAGL